MTIYGYSPLSGLGMAIRENTGIESFKEQHQQGHNRPLIHLILPTFRGQCVHHGKGVIARDMDKSGAGLQDIVVGQQG